MERNFPASTVQSKPGASGLLLVGATFYERKARSHGLHIWWPGFILLLEVSHHYLLTHQARFKGNATPWKKTVCFLNKNPPTILAMGGGEGTEKGEKWVFQSTQKHKPLSICGGPPSFLTQRSQWTSSLLNVISSVSDPRAQDPYITPYWRELMGQHSDWPFKYFSLKGDYKIWERGRQRITNT